MRIPIPGELPVTDPPIPTRMAPSRRIAGDLRPLGNYYRRDRREERREERLRIISS